MTEDFRKIELLMALRNHGIRDQAILEAIERTPRELFLDASFQAQAYADHALPIACGQTISQPYVVAYMTEQMAVKPHHRVLEVGTGSGYQAAVLSRLAREVYTIERFRTLADTARVRLETLGFNNAHVVLGDGIEGLPEHAPFDRIIVTAAAEQIPQPLVEQLAEGGTLLLPLGPHASTQVIVRLSKSGDKVSREDLIGVRLVPLLGGQARVL